MRYEITNPSDPYHMEADDFAAACGAALLLGEGRYGLHGEDDKPESTMPIFIFGGAEEWWQERFGEPLDGALESKKPAIIAALRTVMVGSVEDVKRMRCVLAAITDPIERARAEQAWHDSTRSSLNDIGRRAMQLVEALDAVPKKSEERA